MSDAAVDIVVVGAGLGGIYAAHRFREQGFEVVGLDGAAGFGGVWYHNRYPGARVDVDSVHYCYHFAPDIYEKWRWSERYAAQPELLRYLNWVADELDVRTLFRFGTWVEAARWVPGERCWQLTTSTGDDLACRFLVMCTGNLSEPKPVPFPGLERFQGEWALTTRWPHHDLALEGRRVAVVGTGSSGVQTVSEVAKVAEHLFVFQRTPHYAVPAQNAPLDRTVQDELADSLVDRRAAMFSDPPADASPDGYRGPRKLQEYTPEEQQQMLQAQWDFGGHGIAYIFADIQTDWSTNEVVSNFVRDQVRELVHDPDVAERLLPEYPIGTRRLILEIGYYDALNQDNVTLVDMREEPIEEITETGVRTCAGEYDVDVLIFALGFRPFLGAIDRAGVVNEHGVRPSDVWRRGPRTVFGLMTPGFPNLFHPTNAGSTSVLSNLFLINEFHVDWLSECFAYMEQHGYRTVEATDAGADEWQDQVAAQAEHIIRRQVDNYMVHVNADDGTRIFQPWYGGFPTYVPAVLAATRDDYRGLAFS